VCVCVCVCVWGGVWGGGGGGGVGFHKSIQVETTLVNLQYFPSLKVVENT
jgi:hypothetical protein